MKLIIRQILWVIVFILPCFNFYKMKERVLYDYMDDYQFTNKRFSDIKHTIESLKAKVEDYTGDVESQGDLIKKFIRNRIQKMKEARKLILEKQILKIKEKTKKKQSLDNLKKEVDELIRDKKIII